MYWIQLQISFNQHDLSTVLQIIKQLIRCPHCTAILSSLYRKRYPLQDENREFRVHQELNALAEANQQSSLCGVGQAIFEFIWDTNNNETILECLIIQGYITIRRGDSYFESINFFWLFGGHNLWIYEHSPQSGVLTSECTSFRLFSRTVCFQGRFAIPFYLSLPSLQAGTRCSFKNT